MSKTRKDRQFRPVAVPDVEVGGLFGQRQDAICQSTAAIIELTPFSDTRTVGGASSDVVVIVEELPMCMQIGMPASPATAQSGSQ